MNTRASAITTMTALPLAGCGPFGEYGGGGTITGITVPRLNKTRSACEHSTKQCAPTVRRPPDKFDSDCLPSISGRMPDEREIHHEAIATGVGGVLTDL